jgi:competence CoiA-like predicted nuclease
VVNEKKRKSRQYRTLLSVLSSGSTPEARVLLKKYTGEDAFSENDLEDKLAKLYSTSNTKLDLEKEFAVIHPHKEFILKYCMEKQPDIDINKLNTGNTEIVKQVEIITPPTKEQIENPTEGKACTCGCQKYANADGDSGSGMNSANLTLAVLGLVSIVAIAGTIMYLKSNKN